MPCGADTIPLLDHRFAGPVQQLAYNQGRE
jgi:hypothetical protein